MNYYVYCIKSNRKNWLYVGMTNDIDRRIRQHQAGYSKSTAHYRPFKLIFKERYPDSNTARAREKYLKTSSGKRYIRVKYDIIKED